MVLLAPSSTLFFLGAAGSALSAFSNNVFLIRHGEKPDDDGLQGLSPEGQDRAQCLTGVFGQGSSFSIGHILAEMPQNDGDHRRPLDTVTPLAQELGLTVDTSCHRNDPDCVADAVKAFAKTNSANVLICWEHKMLTDIMASLGVDDPPKNPGHAFNLIFTVRNEKLISQTSENCTGLDN